MYRQTEMAQRFYAILRISAYLILFSIEIPTSSYMWCVLLNNIFR